VMVTINGKEYKVPRKEFSTGSLGWNLNDKIEIAIDGHDIKVQIGMNLIVVGSKDLPDDKPKTDAPPPAAADADEAEDAAESDSGQAKF
jgi:hypothetical protein